MTLTSDSNPCIYGSIHLRLDGRKSSIGGTWWIGETVKGHFGGELKYVGISEEEAMKAVEDYAKSLPECIIRLLRD